MNSFWDKVGGALGVDIDGDILFRSAYPHAVENSAKGKAAALYIGVRMWHGGSGLEFDCSELDNPESMERALELTRAICELYEIWFTK